MTQVQGAKMLQKELRKLVLPFLVPSFGLYLYIWLWPNIDAVYWSMTNYAGVAIEFADFIGFANFIEMANDKTWIAATSNTLYWAVGTVVTLLPGSMLFAVLLMNVKYGRGFFKTVTFLPTVLSLIIVGLLWVFFLEPQIGLVNGTLAQLGLEKQVAKLFGVRELNWLGKPKLARPTIVVVQFWQGLGFYALLFMAAIAKVPPELIDAAKIDGAAGWRLFRYITWPLIFQTTQTVFMLLIINSLQIFTILYAMGMGSGALSNSMATYIYQKAFTDHRWGYATALSVALMVLVMGCTLASRELTKRDLIEM